jgi:rSAM/selenodomain-associated transferase 1
LSNNARNAIGLFVKAPRHGLVKTRLQPDFSKEQSLHLYRAMVQDIMDCLKLCDFADVVVFYHPSDGEKECQDWLGERLVFVPQQGSGLGLKMNHAFQWATQNGYAKTILIGSDFPGIGLPVLQEALEKLEQSDLVLGPTWDGGYYLIGLKDPKPELFQNIPWSTDQVYQLTKNKADENHLKVAALHEERDLDTYEDVLFLKEYIKRNNHDPVGADMHHTREALKNLFIRRGESHGT